MQTNPSETSTPRAMSRTASETNPLAMLAADHETMRQLAEDFQAALEAGADEQSNIVAQICEALEMHTALEEEILYPAARKVTELAVLIDKAREEHERLKETVDEIRALEPSDPQIASLVLQLAEDVEAHVVEEEDVLFPELECRMSSQLTEIGRQMNRLRQRMTQA